MAKPIKVAEKKLRDAYRELGKRSEYSLWLTPSEVCEFIVKYGATSVGISAYFDIESLRKAGKSNTIFVWGYPKQFLTKFDFKSPQKCINSADENLKGDQK